MLGVQRWEVPLPDGWRAKGVVVSGNGAVWLTTVSGLGKLAIWVLPCGSNEWECCRRLQREACIAGAIPSGVWIACGHKIWRISETAINDCTVDIPFAARHISQGADGTLWALGGAIQFGGYPVRRFDEQSSTWYLLPQPAAAVRIAGAPDGTAWTVNSRGDVWRLHPLGAGNFADCHLIPDCRKCCFTSRTSVVRDLTVAHDGTIWCLEAVTTEDINRVCYIGNGSAHRAVPLRPELRAISMAAPLVSSSNRFAVKT